MKEIFHRVSIRRYEKRTVEREKILQILRAGMQAPSAKNQQPWEFYVVTDPEKILAVSEFSPFSGCAAGAPVLIISVYRKEGLRAPAFAQIDMAIAQENMWLETDSLGLGGVWLGVAPEQRRMDKIRKILDLPDVVEPFSVFVLGYPAETRQQQDRFEEGRIHFIE
ncbi:MAG TPA: nitroreductase family protein [Lachnospiraceae bacterium]|nr:nitroreductase family protein [Lachnospiraceae bacterium]